MDEEDNTIIDNAAEQVVELGNRMLEADDDADSWDVADGLLAGAIQFWLYSRQPCDDPRCENCMTHCGYDPSGALGTNYQRGDNWKNFRYNFWPRPPRFEAGHQIDAFNGCSAGKGHLAEARAAIKQNGDVGGTTTADSCASAGTCETEPAVENAAGARKNG